MRSRIIFSAIFTAVILIAMQAGIVCPAEKWQGVDEAVVKKIAKEHGREPGGPLINTEQGDLQLFLFLLAGAAGGFTAGYYWRKLVENRNPGTEERGQGDGTSQL